MNSMFGVAVVFYSPLMPFLINNQWSVLVHQGKLTNITLCKVQVIEKAEYICTTNEKNQTNIKHIDLSTTIKNHCVKASQTLKKKIKDSTESLFSKSNRRHVWDQPCFLWLLSLFQLQHKLCFTPILHSISYSTSHFPHFLRKYF